jgi:hypothetical protein
VYVVLIGGDIFPNWRHWVPLVGLGACAASIGLQGLLAAAHRRAAWGWAGAMGALALWGALHPAANQARRESWEWNAFPLGGVLRDAFAHDAPLLAVEAAGSLPYVTGFPALDMLGLNDRYLAHHPPQDFGTGPYGHELGEGAYFLRRAPDLVCFGTPPCARRPKYRGGRQMAAAAEFAREYVPVRLRAGAPGAMIGHLWVRRSGRLGIRETEGSVLIPALLFANGPGAVAHPAEGGWLLTELEPRATARLGDVELPAGHWELSVAGASAELSLKVRRSSSSQDDHDPRTLWLDGPTRVDLELTAGSRGATFAAVRLHSAGEAATARLQEVGSPL